MEMKKLLESIDSMGSQLDENIEPITREEFNDLRRDVMALEAAVRYIEHTLGMDK